MIIARLKGGFGNQLFQYATGRALAVKRGEELFLDTSYLLQDPKGAYTRRNFELDQVRYKSKFADKDQVKKFEVNGFVARVFNKLKLRSHLIFNENEPGYIPAIKKLPSNVLLNGYWQTEKYFSEIRDQLINEISPAFEFTHKGKYYSEKIKDTNSVSVHVRRGDYVNLKSASDFHLSRGPEYYKKAADILESEFQDLYYFVFSDDIEWCKKELSFLSNVDFIEDEPGKYSAQDMFLMSYCKNNIIANSSYSWWSAWININPQKKVIAPAQWFKNPSAQSPDLLPESWLKI